MYETVSVPGIKKKVHNKVHWGIHSWFPCSGVYSFSAANSESKFIFFCILTQKDKVGLNILTGHLY